PAKVAKAIPEAKTLMAYWPELKANFGKDLRLMTSSATLATSWTQTATAMPDTASKASTKGVDAESVRISPSIRIKRTGITSPAIAATIRKRIAKRMSALMALSHGVRSATETSAAAPRAAMTPM